MNLELEFDINIIQSFVHSQLHESIIITQYIIDHIDVQVWNSWLESIQKYNKLAVKDQLSDNDASVITCENEAIEHQQEKTRDRIKLAKEIKQVVNKIESNLSSLKAKSMADEIDKLITKYNIPRFQTTITLYDLQFSYRRSANLKINYCFEPEGLTNSVSFTNCEILQKHEPFKICKSKYREIFGYVTIKSKYLTFTGICFDFVLYGGILQVNRLQFSGTNMVTFFNNKPNDSISKVEGTFNVTESSEIEFELLPFKYRLRPFQSCFIEITRSDVNGKLLLSGIMDNPRENVHPICPYLPLNYNDLDGYLLQGDLKWNIQINRDTVSLNIDTQGIIYYDIDIDDFWAHSKCYSFNENNTR